MYTKLFRSLTSSSVWIEDSDTIKLWVFLMAEADEKGFVFGSVVTIADRCKLSVSRTQEILTKFAAPDPFSSDLTRNPENAGRRIEVIDGGWLVINLEYYRGLHDVGVRRVQVREANKRLRDRRKKASKKRDQTRSPVIKSDHARSGEIPSDAYSSADASAYAEKELSCDADAPPEKGDPDGWRNRTPPLVLELIDALRGAVKRVSPEAVFEKPNAKEAIDGHALVKLYQGGGLAGVPSDRQKDRLLFVLRVAPRQDLWLGKLYTLATVRKNLSMMLEQTRKDWEALKDDPDIWALVEAST